MQLIILSNPSPGSGESSRPDEHFTDTPFGPSGSRSTVELNGIEIGLLRRAGDPRATMYAVKASGASRVVALEHVAGLNRLLHPGDWLIPDDWIEQTQGGPTTFFTEHGLGYVLGRPAFCPQVRQWVARASDAVARRVFDTGVYVGRGGTRWETPAEARMWAGWGGDVVGQALLPEATLARELGLCYAALLWVGRPGGAAHPTLEFPATDWEQILVRLTANLDHDFTCPCQEYTRRVRQVLGEDWRKWVKTWPSPKL